MLVVSSALTCRQEAPATSTRQTLHTVVDMGAGVLVVPMVALWFMLLVAATGAVTVTIATIEVSGPPLALLNWSLLGIKAGLLVSPHLGQISWVNTG